MASDDLRNHRVQETRRSGLLDHLETWTVCSRPRPVCKRAQTVWTPGGQIVQGRPQAAMDHFKRPTSPTMFQMFQMGYEGRRRPKITQKTKWARKPDGQANWATW